MIPEAREVRLKPKVRKVLEARCRAPSTPQGEVKRARIVLLAADGHSTRSIAKEVGVQPHREQMAAPFCRSWAFRAERPPARRQAADLRSGDEQAHSGAVG